MSGPWEDYAQAAPAQAQGGPWTDYQPASAAPAAPRSQGGAFLSSVARGALMGYGDELSGAIRGGLNVLRGGEFTPAYEAERDRRRGQQRQDEAQFPATAAAGTIAGGVGMPMGAAGRFAQGAASIPGAIVRGALVGGALGGTAGFGEGEGGTGERLASAGRGALLGGALGGALPPVVAGLSAAGGAAGRLTGAGDPAAAAQRIANRDLARSGITPDDVLAASRAAGPAPVALADLGGENLLGTAQTIARLPGRGQQMARDLVAARGGEAQGARLAGAVREGVGDTPFASTVDDIMAARARNAAPLYDRAYAVTLPRDRALERFLDLPEVRAGVQRGIALAEREAVANGTPFDRAALGVRFDDAGNMALTGEGFPTRLLDVAKRGLDDAIDGQTDATTRRVTSEGRSLVQLRDGLLREVDRLNPDFAAARAAYGERSRLLDAMQGGRDFLNEAPGAGEWTARRLLAMQPPERQAFRDGVARALLDRVERATDGAELTRLNQMFGTPALRTRLRATFDTQAEYDAFAATMQREIGMAATNRAVNPRAGSQTMPLSERRMDLASPPPSPGAAAVLNTDRAAFQMPDLPRSTSLFEAGRNTLSGLNRAMQGRALERNADALAPLLFTTDEAGRNAAAQALVNRQISDAYRRGLLAPAARGLLQGGAVGGGLLAN